MPGDYTRVTFNSLRDYLGVLMQQGRVLLDADFNELVEMLDRRFRAETIDIIGHCKVPRETPHGFRIQISGSTITIGRGRLYADGLLAENHGTGEREFDRVLAEERGTMPVAYADQPYLPGAATLAPLPSRGGPHLVYLDVWQREVTHVEEPTLVEKAVGVDTATRLQTVWQVRVLADVPQGTTCATPDAQIPRWPEIIRPSAGRLTTSPVGVATDLDPCPVPAAGGFRGIENRLYRVEIHQGGPLSQASFKWSRDNASIATRVTGISASRDVLTVARTGRDAALRFSPGDWIEVTDDHHELYGTPGIMRKVLIVDDVAQTVTLTTALPAGEFHLTNPASRHTRIRRWDQKGQVLDAANNVVADVDASGGVIPIPAGGSVVLEDGVQVTFSVSVAGGEFRSGDYWVFAARTADASLEILSQAPPRGIHHHYCRLALVTFPNTVVDCRTFWPPEFDGGCDCTECVSAEAHNSGIFTIQMAMDRVRAEGGKVCLGPGIFQLGVTPVVIDGAQSVQIQGQGWRTILLYTGADGAIQVASAAGLEISELCVIALAQKEPSWALTVQNSLLVRAERCTLVQWGGPDTSGAAVGIGGILMETLIRDNVLAGAGGVEVLARLGAPAAGVSASARLPRSYTFTWGLRIEDNLIYGRRRGVVLGGFAIHLGETRVRGNSIYGVAEAAFVALGWVAAPRLRNSRLEVTGNTILTRGAGIAVGTDHTRIEGNDIASSRPGAEAAYRDGILLVAGLLKKTLEGCQVIGNRIGNLGGDGISIRAPLVSAIIRRNVIQGVAGGGIVMEQDAEAVSLSIEDNHILSSGTRNLDNLPLSAVRVNRARHAVITGNVIGLFGAAAVQNPARAGIEVVASEQARIAGNELVGVGPPGAFLGVGAGIMVQSPFTVLEVIDNTVRRAADTPAAIDPSTWYGIRIGEREAPTATGGMYPVAVSLAADEYVFVGARSAAVLTVGRVTIGVRGNVVDSYGAGAAIDVAAPGTTTLGENRCYQVNPAGRVTTVVDLDASRVVASGNHLERTPRSESLALRISVPNGPFTVYGNITAGTIRVNNAGLPAPWDALNVMAF